jgi:NAD(P)-dependent dehydrogenase (short-subunit alcohol dehydrogenase family)
VVKTLSVELQSRKIIVVTFSPGWVQTDMGGANAPLTPKESITGMRRVIAGLQQKDSGRFLKYDGREVPW